MFAATVSFFHCLFRQGFVGVLGVDAVMLVWDQLFMSGWQRSLLVNVCLVIIELLREELLTTANYHSVKSVLLDKACELYTTDVQQGIVYLTNGGALRDVNSMKQWVALFFDVIHVVCKLLRIVSILIIIIIIIIKRLFSYMVAPS